MNEILETIFRRRSIRKYTDQPVETEKLETLLKAAMAAPSATNNQPWEFVVVTDADLLAALRKKLLFGNYQAPAAIIVCANPKGKRGLVGKLYWVQDCSAAMENILLAAAGLGLGSVWIGVHPRQQVAASVRAVAGIPEDVHVLGIAYIGYPAEEKEARTQYNPDLVFWQKYGSRISPAGE